VDLVPGATHVALDLEQGALGVEDGLALGDLADQPDVVLEADDGGGGAVAFAVDEDGGLATLHDGDHAVGRAQVDPDGFGHGGCSFAWALRAPKGDVMNPRNGPDTIRRRSSARAEHSSAGA